MKIIERDSNRRAQRAFTLRELIVLMTLGLIMAFLFFTAIPRHGNDAVRSNCGNNLKQVGLAFRIWAGDNNGQYPMQLFTNAAGGPKFADDRNAFRYFQWLSNELSTPKILICPENAKRRPATNFTWDFDNSRVSYFIDMNAAETNDKSILTGDTHLTNNTPKKNGMLSLAINQPCWWTKERHKGAGNLVAADGSVAQITTPHLRRTFVDTGHATNWLLFP